MSLTDPSNEDEMPEVLHSTSLGIDSDAESTMPSGEPSQENVAHVANASQSCFEPGDSGESSDEGTEIV